MIDLEDGVRLQSCAPSKHRWVVQWSGVKCRVCGRTECY